MKLVRMTCSHGAARAAAQQAALGAHHARHHHRRRRGDRHGEHRPGRRRRRAGADPRASAPTSLMVMPGRDHGGGRALRLGRRRDAHRRRRAGDRATSAPPSPAVTYFRAPGRAGAVRRPELVDRRPGRHRRRSLACATGRSSPGRRSRERRGGQPRRSPCSGRRSSTSSSARGRTRSARRSASRTSRSASSACSRRKGQTAWGQDQDDVVLVPFTTAERRVLGTELLGTVDMIHATAPRQRALEEAAEQISAAAAPAPSHRAGRGGRLHGAQPGRDGAARRRAPAR